MINIAELLKDAPEGMKLYSPLFGEVAFAEVMDTDYVPIRVMKRGYGLRFDKYGRYMGNEYPDAECLLFPSKDCRSWEGWKLPIEPKSKFKAGDWIVRGKGFVYEPSLITERRDYYICELLNGERATYTLNDVYKNFHLWTIADAKDGDVLVNQNGEMPFVFKSRKGNHIYCHCAYTNHKDIFFEKFLDDGRELHWINLLHEQVQPATKEQRDLLFAKMKEAGYEWDADKKELREIIDPKFKVGDDIKTGNTIETIAEINYATRSYSCESGRTIWFENQDLWHLVPKPHYDITNFKAGMPVLVRDANDKEWRYVLYSHTTGRYGLMRFNAGATIWNQCIPFEGNEHLLGTTDPCDEQYINW